MKVSVIVSADATKKFQVADHAPGTIALPGVGWIPVQESIPSEIIPTGFHSAFSRTIFLDEFLTIITEYELFSLDEIGYNMAIRLSASKPNGVIKVFAFPELEDHETKGEMGVGGGPDEAYYNAAWREILNTIANGAKNAAAKAPQPLKSKGGNADAIPSPGRSKASRQR